MAQGMDPAALLKSAVAALNRRDRKEVAGLLHQLVQNPPPIDQHWASVSRMAGLVGEVETSMLASRYFFEARKDMDRLLHYGGVLGGLGRVQEALSLVEKVVPQAANDARVHNFLATCQSQLGQLEEARESFKETLRLRPGAGGAWFGLGEIYDIGNDGELFAKLQAECKVATDPEDRGALYYALGKAFDGLKEYDRAFAAYEEGASTLRKVRAFDWTNADGLRDRALEFDNTLNNALNPSACASGEPIFVTGLPRSGTTLVEQILCSHSGVKEGAEHGLMRTALFGLEFAGPDGYRRYQAAHGPRAWTQGAEDYLDLVRQRFGAGRVVDKALANTRIMGIIAHALPNAPIIWLRRNPMDVAWSCFRIRFSQQHDWTWSLKDIARYMIDEDKVWSHYAKSLGDRVLTVPYEQLVANPDEWMGRILRHAGLEFEEGVKDFHMHKRAIATASVAQVRRPISTAAVDQWRNYERHMKPFIDAYGA